ncbi:MAG: SUMF1/EgtB/PvdO family nonheme iron enzyme [Verrucomicrobiota bacterium]
MTLNFLKPLPRKAMVLLGFFIWQQAMAQGNRFFRISGPAISRILSVKQDGTVLWTNAQAGVIYTFQTGAAATGATNWIDYVQITGKTGNNSNRLFDPQPPVSMALIPAGVFTMGDSLDNDSTALPLHSVYVSGIYMDQYDVTMSLWDGVYHWALTHGYNFDNAGLGSGSNNPEQMINWYDCVKWCNARSEMAGKKPAYYRDAGLSVPYRTGQFVPYVNWNSGYRLPTEAEWEKAARGGLSGRRYPWGNAITSDLAHYNDSNETPTPVNTYPPNGYGLYDMSGNMWQWCWDWYGNYDSAAQIDPHGPVTGTKHVDRGGGMVGAEYDCRVCDRDTDDPTFSDNYVGFRTVLPANP